MKSPSLFKIGLLLAGIFIIAFIWSRFANPIDSLPVYNPSDVNPQLVDHEIRHIEKGHRVSEFHLINQNGDTITQHDYANSIYITDFFFTRCPTICIAMTSNMVKLQEEFKSIDEIKLLSISVTPFEDSVTVLREYADRKGVIDSKWNVTTGDKRHIYSLARKSYFAVTDDGDGGQQDFIHTPNFILVDKKKQIRGIYNGTDSTDIQRLITDTKSLLN